MASTIDSFEENFEKKKDEIENPRNIIKYFKSFRTKVWQLRDIAGFVAEDKESRVSDSHGGNEMHMGACNVLYSTVMTR